MAYPKLEPLMNSLESRASILPISFLRSASRSVLNQVTEIGLDSDAMDEYRETRDKEQSTFEAVMDAHGFDPASEIKKILTKHQKASKKK